MTQSRENKAAIFKIFAKYGADIPYKEAKTKSGGTITCTKDWFDRLRKQYKQTKAAIKQADDKIAKAIHEGVLSGAKRDGTMKPAATAARKKIATRAAKKVAATPELNRSKTPIGDAITVAKDLISRVGRLDALKIIENL